MNRLLILLVALVMTGCATSPRIIDYDPENDVMIGEEGREISVGPTPDHVIAAQHKGITVEVIREDNFYDAEDEATRQQWSVIVSNTNRSSRCVGVIWRLMDFRFISEHPTMVLVERKSSLQLGTMVGETMVVDGITIAPPPSGYVHEMQVRSPDSEALEGDECMFLPDEEDIIQDEDDIKVR